MENTIKLELVQHSYPETDPTFYLDSQVIAGPKAFGDKEIIASYKLTKSDLENIQSIVMRNLNYLNSETEDETLWDIYEEGYRTNGEYGTAHYIGRARGKTFFDACKKFIKENGYGETWVNLNGEARVGNWGCRWFPTLAEAQETFG